MHGSGTFLGTHPALKHYIGRDYPRATLQVVENPAGVPKPHWLLEIAVPFHWLSFDHGFFTSLNITN